MSDIEQIQDALRRFNQERDWDQFHNGKDLAIGLSVEASELLEAFLWKAPEDANPANPSWRSICSCISSPVPATPRMLPRTALPVRPSCPEDGARTRRKY